MWLSLVERSFRVGEVGSSNLPIPTNNILPRRYNFHSCGCSLVVKLQPSKLAMRVRFPPPAPLRVNKAGPKRPALLSCAY